MRRSGFFRKMAGIVIALIGAIIIIEIIPIWAWYSLLGVLLVALVSTILRIF